MRNDIRPRIALCGPGRSGKDTAARWIAAHTPLRYAGATSEFLLDEIVARTGADPEDAWATRHANRDLWYRIGNELRAEDPLVLVRRALERSELLVGCRDGDELVRARAEGLIDFVVWIERDVPPDPTLTYDHRLADVVVANPDPYDPTALYDALAEQLRAWAPAAVADADSYVRWLRPEARRRALLGQATAQPWHPASPTGLFGRPASNADLEAWSLAARRPAVVLRDEQPKRRLSHRGSGPTLVIRVVDGHVVGVEWSPHGG